MRSAYKNSVDAIYIDPPYNTGSADDFIYPDKFEYSDEQLRQRFNMTDNDIKRFHLLNGSRTHSAWLTFMYPRLFLAKQLLKDTGVVFVSINDAEQANLKLLMDSVFGEASFIENFIWIKNSTKNLSRTTSTNHEYILCYAKNIAELASCNTFRIDKPGIKEVEAILKQANDAGWTAERATQELKAFYKSRPDLKGITMYDHVDVRTDPISGRKCLKAYRLDNISAPKSTGVAETYQIKHPITGLIYFYDDETHVPQFKRYLDTVTTEVMKSTISDFTDGKKELMRLFDGSAYFNNPKPTTLIKYLLGGVGTDATIMDFFAGSGTTADAVMQMNIEDGGSRRFILCTLPESTFHIDSNGKENPTKGGAEAYRAGYRSIDQLSMERIRRAESKILDNYKANHDGKLPPNWQGGFKHYYVVKPSQPTLNTLDDYNPDAPQTLDAAQFDNMITPFSAPELSNEYTKLSGDASGAETILETLLLNDGYDLNEPVEQLDLDGYIAYLVPNQRVYLIDYGWTSAQSKQLLNKVGKREDKMSLSSVVLWGYTFNIDSINELMSGLRPLGIPLEKRF